MTDTYAEFETKAPATAMPQGSEALFGELMGAFEVFKQTNDRRLAALESRGAADGLDEAKLDRLNAVLDGTKAALDRLALERNRPSLDPARTPILDDSYARNFAAYVKRGEEKALSIGSNADGGYLVPPETETEISRLLVQVSPLRSLATVRQISNMVYKKPVTTTGPTVGWSTETGARTVTASQQLDILTFPTAELYAMPSATTAFLDDTAVDVGAWIAEEVNAAFAAQETTAFVTGDGTNKPKGFLSETPVANSSWAWGKLGYVASGAAGALPTPNPSDVLFDLVYALKAQYRQNARWLMNRRTQAAIRKLKDSTGNYLWQPAITAAGRASLLGVELLEVEDMPDVAANAFAIAFGDFRRGYLIVDRLGVNVLRDPYSNKPYVMFYTTKRVGGGVQDYDAIKLLKFAAS
jgi:HK97 family phage major capsid protein